MELIIRFTDNSQSFCNGVEFGRLLEKMQRGDESVTNNNFPVRIENKELIENTCKQYGYTATFGQHSFNEWVEFIGIKKSFTEN